MDEISALLQEDRRFPPTDAWRREAIANDSGVYARAAADPEAFWAGFARELEWMTPWSRVLEWNAPDAKWFVGGKLNASVNCLDRHIRGLRRNKAAFRWEGEPGDVRTLTYWDLYVEVRKFANVLKSLGVKRGDRVAIYMPLIPEVAIAMLACTRIGAIHSVVFGGFSPDSLRDRINDSKCKVLVTADGGYLVGVTTTTKLVFDLKDDDVFWCTADVGWVTGHSYLVYGPLANGATCVMYEGAPDWPERDRFWSICERNGVTVLYTAPTAIRAFMKWGDEHPAKHDLSRLRLLGAVGEPINPEAWMWYHEQIGKERCPIVDTWWQTETGAIVISPLPGITETKPGSATTALPGFSAALLDAKANEIKVGGGLLALTKPWPSMLRTIWG